ncbi:hypothetical protein PG997_002222 [Apiospora hydei]|uniref:Uncharacterized protein n=1 Tax=Apiospora hydei TaxID=1337664 RepID=A0ABR1X8S7_9PEZI
MPTSQELTKNSFSTQKLAYTSPDSQAAESRSDFPQADCDATIPVGSTVAIKQTSLQTPGKNPAITVTSQSLPNQVEVYLAQLNFDIDPSLEPRWPVIPQRVAAKIIFYTTRSAMSAIRALVLFSLAAVAVADGLYVHSNELAAHFAKRQQMPEPGTPAYNCHDNCGQSIIASRGEDPCHDKAFLTDYAVCLSCAGPDNYGIWMYYGGALAKAASSCGLSTTAGTEKTTDVPQAIPAAKGSSTATSPTATPKEPTATSARPSSTGEVISTVPSSTTAGPSTTSSTSAISTSDTPPHLSLTTHTSTSSQPTTSPTVPTAGASSAVCIKLSGQQQSQGYR